MIQSRIISEADRYGFSENAIKILNKRYFAKNKNGDISETLTGMFYRVADFVSNGEEKSEKKKYRDKFYDIMLKRDFLPNSPTLFNAGLDSGCLFACFVFTVEDSMKSIMKICSEIAMTQKYGGGTGISFSRLRPGVTRIKSTHGKACGPLAVMRLYSEASNMVTQAGKRNGANMGILRVDHPDILEFIRCKSDGKSFQNYNISVAITDEFMEAVRSNDFFTLRFNKAKYLTLPAREIWDEIIKSAWETGDPGLFFIDRANVWNPLSHLDKIESTNPCGEVAGINGYVCVLGSINLSNCVTQMGSVDWAKIQELSILGTRFLNNAIRVSMYPTKESAKIARTYRPSGLGIMGLADLFLKLKMTYGSVESLILAEEIMKTINHFSWQESTRCASSNGGELKLKNEFFADKYNCQVTTVAPTGTISLLAGCSSGIEPNFAYSWTSHQAEQELTHKHPLVSGFKKLPPYFITADAVSPDLHVKMQSVIQAHTDNGVSKTVNLLNSATIEDIEKTYFLSYDSGCRGITAFRDGCKGEQVLVKHDVKPDLSTIEESQLDELIAISSNFGGACHTGECGLG